MSSTNTSNLSCARCHVSQDILSHPLKRCARCRTLQYCSHDCQKRDWPSHKQQCREGGLDPVGPRVRTTMRLTGHRALGVRASNNQGESGTIYYLQTCTPHLRDISMSGPFYPLESIVPQVVRNFGKECTEGQLAFAELVNENLLSSFSHMSSPIKGNPNQIKTIRLIKEENPHMVAKLPCPAWYIIDAELYDFARNHERSEYPQVKEMNFHETFDNLQTANKEGKQVAARIQANFPGSQILDMENENGCYSAGVFATGRGGRTMIVIEVRYDPGTILPVDEESIRFMESQLL